MSQFVLQQRAEKRIPDFGAKMRQQKPTASAPIRKSGPMLSAVFRKVGGPFHQENATNH